jgi:hypothetical protein
VPVVGSDAVVELVDRAAPAFEHLQEDAFAEAQHAGHAQRRVVGLALAQDGQQFFLVDGVARPRRGWRT